MDKMTKAYLDRASEIIGERTKSEIFHDDTVVEALIQGRTIKEALSIAERSIQAKRSNGMRGILVTSRPITII